MKRPRFMASFSIGTSGLKRLTRDHIGLLDVASSEFPATEPNEALLQAIVRSPAKLVKGTTGATAAARPAPVRSDNVIERTAASKRVIALQRALAEYGYGQIKPSGMIDPDTQAAIEKFERERKLPITGQASDRVVRELAAMTGRPLE